MTIFHRDALDNRMSFGHTRLRLPGAHRWVATRALRTPLCVGRRAAAILVAIGLAFGLSACSGGDEEPRLTVFAAASLTDAFRALDPAQRYSFAGSDQLAFQIEQGAPADVFAAASPTYPQALFRKGLVTRPRTFATNRLVLVVPDQNPAHIARVDDVARPGTRLVVGDAGVPVGDYTRAVLDRLGLRRALGNVVSNERDVRGVMAKVALGEADAGFVYASDLRSAEGRVEAIPIPARGQPDVEYQVAVVRSSPRHARAEEFVARLMSVAGRRALAAKGFGPPP
jgi:molybdate transport system substrate-binding protein